MTTSPAVDEYTAWIAELKASRIAFNQTLPRAFAELSGGVAECLQMVSETVNNATRAISEELSRELSILAGRQAASAALQVAQFLLFAGYLLTLFVLYVVKKCKKHRKRQVEAEVELMEQKLQERKAKRKAAARPSPADK